MTDVYLTGQNGRRVQLARGVDQGAAQALSGYAGDDLQRDDRDRGGGDEGQERLRLRKRDPAFAALWQEALAQGYETLERAVLRGALEGLNAIEIEGEAALDETDEVGAAADDIGKPGHAAPGSGIPRAPVGLARLQFALALLNRYRNVVGADDRRGRAQRRTTAAETDALLRNKLDGLARQLAAEAARAGKVEAPE